jgi:glycosyltransferase involved in cell wall biosynthesis
MLAVIETHPIQYHAPVYRALASRWGVPVTAVYGSDFSVAGYHDAEFGAAFKWDTDLLSGYDSVFLSRVESGGASTADDVSAAGVRAALAKLRPSAVMVVGYSPRFHRQAWMEARRTGAPVLFRGETSDVAVDRNWIRGQVRSAALRAGYATCGRLLYIGKRSRSHFERLGVSDDRLVFSPYCVDLAPFEWDEAARNHWRDATRAELGLAADDLAVLFSGKLSHRKGVDLIVDAARVLPAAVRDRTVLVFLGDGDERERLATMASASPTVRTAFLGFRNQTQLSRYYHAADVMTLPSRYSETWGLVVNEALQHGVPCVVSDRVGCAPDLIVPGVTGEVCEAESVSALAGSLLRVLSMSGRTATREACRRHVDGYSVDRAAEGIAQAYTAVARAPQAVGQ